MCVCFVIGLFVKPVHFRMDLHSSAAVDCVMLSSELNASVRGQGKRDRERALSVVKTFDNPFLDQLIICMRVLSLSPF